MILFESRLEKMIQKGFGFPYRTFMKSRFLILLCFNHLSVAFTAQQADVPKPYEGPFLPADPNTLTGKVMTGRHM